MIYHISISAGNPRHVASVLAEVLGGKTFHFPGRSLICSWRSAGMSLAR